MLETNNPRLWIYEQMVKSRYFEETIKIAYLEGKQPLFNMAKGPIPGEMHLSNGQEPCAAGVCAHLQPEDFVTATHRPHHVAIAKGVDLNAMAAEIFGKVSGLSGGRGGHMHLYDPTVNFSCSGIVGQGLAPALGAAVARQMSGGSHVAVSFIGEGAANQGAFHESLNLAAVWNAPVVFIIEDNSYGISVAKRDCTAIERNSDRAGAYGIPGVFVPGNDPDAVYDAAGEAVSRARQGGGPSLIEIETYRLEGHFMGDAEQYRPKGEVDRLTAIDPIPIYRCRLVDEGVDSSLLDTVDGRARKEVDDAIQFARAARDPEASDAFDSVFV